VLNDGTTTAECWDISCLVSVYSGKGNIKEEEGGNIGPLYASKIAVEAKIRAESIFVPNLRISGFIGA